MYCDEETSHVVKELRQSCAEGNMYRAKIQFYWKMLVLIAVIFREIINLLTPIVIQREAKNLENLLVDVFCVCYRDSSSLRSSE